MREYTRDEAAEARRARRAPLVAFDRVEHAPGRTRLLVVAERPAPQN